MAILGSLFDGLRMSTPPFFPQPGSAAPMIPGMGEPSPTPKPQWLEKLNSPMAQIGLAMLANSRGANGRPNPFGQVAGNAVLGYQQSQRSNAEEDLKRKYMEAQIRRMQEAQQPEGFTLNPGQTRYGPDGKPIVSSPVGAEGIDTPFGKVNPDSYDPSSLEEYKKSIDAKKRIWRL